MRLIAIAALALVAAGCGGSSSGTAEQAPTQTTAQALAFAGVPIVDPSPAPDLALRDQSGKLVRLSDQRGRLALVTFLYTNCPDVCPLIASSLNSALDAIGPARRNVRVLAVSVDPKGDTPAAVRAYAKRMRLLPQFRYLTGTRPQLQRIWRAYNVIAVASSPEVVDHVAYTVLVDQRGERRVIYDSKVKAHQVVHDLRLLMKRSPPA